MANKKISELPEITEITTDDVLPLVDNGTTTTQKATFQTVLDFITGSTFETITANNYVGIRESMILPNFALSSFVFTSSGQTVEVGQIKTGVSFSAVANRTPTSVELSDNYGTATLDLSSTWTSPDTTVNFSSLGVFSKNNTNESVTFTLTAEEGGIVSTKTLTTQWTRYFYWGKSSDPTPALNESFIKLLDDTFDGGSTLKNSKAHTFVVYNMSSEYAYFSYPTSYGSLTQLKDDNAGFPTGFTLVGTISSVSTENGDGNPTDYYLYRTTNALNGFISFTTS